MARLRAAGCVFAEDEAAMLVTAARDPDVLEDMVRRRVAGLPLEHVVGWAEFCGLRIAVDPGVFVPRRRTEFLVGRAVRLARQVAAGRRPVVVDLCCGAGALGVALSVALGAGAGPDNAADGARDRSADGARDRRSARASGGADLHAVDIDPAAVDCARRNAIPVGGRVYQGDLAGPLPAGLRGRVDILLANAPYVPTGDLRLLPPEARDHEPRTALDGGADGLGILRRVASVAPDWLAPGGRLLVEASEWQAPAIAAAMTDSGLIAEVLTSEDYAATIVIGARPG